jgi:hypothetical protein
MEQYQRDDSRDEIIKVELTDGRFTAPSVGNFT